MSNVHDKLIRAFQKGSLKTRSVSPEGKMEWKAIVDVHRAEVPWEGVTEISTKTGKACLTNGHRVFISPQQKKETGDLLIGDSVLGVDLQDNVFYPKLVSTRVVDGRKYMYDLTVSDWHNFVLFDSRVVISNSPDKFYHFRPPEYEGDIGQYNQIFGQIWEDEELLEYLLRSLDWFNMYPPLTQKISNLTILLQSMPAWRTAILWGAITHACTALSLNWIADEFSYSIGGVSLDLEKSSKYESIKQNAEGQFDKATEAKQQTVKFTRGLQQPRFGLGVRSSFGPAVGKGVLSPRSFL